LTFFIPFIAAFFNKTCPYKITGRKIIKVEQADGKTGKTGKTEG
jgi:hypothetical protein